MSTSSARHNGLQVAQISDMLYRHGRDKEVKRKILALLQSDPVFDKAERTFLSRQERLQRGVAVMRRLLEIAEQQNWSRDMLGEALDLIEEPVGLVLHLVAFEPVIESQGTDEQQAYWLPKCRNNEILGCYAQTELGHGSNVQKLETTATYHPESQEFELHSPTTSATKWWIGGLGILATHCIVQAQLLLPDGSGKGVKNCGPHVFILRIRSEDNHEPLPGITIGDIGPKVHNAFSANDNGYMRFNKVRIPHDAMLSRFAKVSKEGAYSKPPHDKLSYGGMIYIRAQMISGLAWSQAKAATIATRYLHVRKQFSDGPGKPERQVFTYPSVYMRILPVLARSYSFILLGDEVKRVYHEMLAKLKDGNAELLADTHAVTSGLKVYVTNAIVEDTETCRRACGGHGFMASAGIGGIYGTVLPSVTYEGDNYILTQQVCRAALKAYTVHLKNGGQSSGIASYLNSLKQADVKPSWSTPEDVARLLARRAAVMVEKFAKAASKTQVWTDLSWRGVPVSNAVTEAFISDKIAGLVNNAGSKFLHGMGQEEGKVLKRLMHFNLLVILERSIPDLLEHQIVSHDKLDNLRRDVDQLAKELLPSALALTDAFDFTDWELNSTLGRNDGRAYEALLDRAQASEKLNLGDKEYMRDLQAIFQQGRARSARQARL